MACTLGYIALFCWMIGLWMLYILEIGLSDIRCCYHSNMYHKQYSQNVVCPSMVSCKVQVLYKPSTALTIFSLEWKEHKTSDRGRGVMGQLHGCIRPWSYARSCWLVFM